MTHSPLAVANFFIEQASNPSRPTRLEHLKIQKLVYCAQGWWLHFRGLDNPLIDEDFQTFRHGPVCPSLYSFLKPHGRINITKFQSPSPDEDPPHITDESDRKFLMWVWERYVDLNGEDMTRLTHRVGSPWYMVVRNNGGKPNHDHKISKEAMKIEFDAIASNFSKV